MRRRSTQKLNAYLHELASAIEHKDQIARSVSSVNVAWHVEHSLLVFNAVVDVLKSSKPTEFKRTFNFLKWYIFIVGSIPRGKARAPKSVRPNSEGSHDQLEKLISSAHVKAAELTSIDPEKFFKHPIFGDLRLNDSIRFLELHTIHHLKIIRSILKSNQ